MTSSMECSSGHESVWIIRIVGRFHPNPFIIAPDLKCPDGSPLLFLDLEHHVNIKRSALLKKHLEMVRVETRGMVATPCTGFLRAVIDLGIPSLLFHVRATEDKTSSIGSPAQFTS